MQAGLSEALPCVPRVDGWWPDSARGWAGLLVFATFSSSSEVRKNAARSGLRQTNCSVSDSEFVTWSKVGESQGCSDFLGNWRASSPGGTKGVGEPGCRKIHGWRAEQPVHSHRIATWRRKNVGRNARRPLRGCLARPNFPSRLCCKKMRGGARGYPSDASAFEQGRHVLELMSDV